MATLRDVNEMSREQLLELVAAMQNGKAKGNHGIKINPIGEVRYYKNKPYECKGTITLWGYTGNRGITMFPKKWLKLLSIADHIRKAIEDNKNVLGWNEEETNGHE